jgi:hypothetical protein
VAIEIVLMLFGGWLLARRLGVCGLIGARARSPAWCAGPAMAFTTELWALVVLQALHSCTFAACHLGAMAFLQRALPHARRGDRPEPLLRSGHRRDAGVRLPVLRPALFRGTASAPSSA